MKENSKPLVKSCLKKKKNKTTFWLQANPAENKWKKSSLKIFNITQWIILDYK